MLLAFHMKRLLNIVYQLCLVHLNSFSTNSTISSSADLINITADHVKHGVEHLDIELLHGEQLLLGLVEGERARVDPPQPVAGDDGGHGRGEVGPVTLLMIILLGVLLSFNDLLNPLLKTSFSFLL